MDNTVIAHFTENQTENGIEMKMTTAKQVGGGGSIPTFQEVVNAGHTSTKGIEINETTVVGIRATSNSKQGIIGESQTNVGVLGNSTEGTGVYGFSQNSVGVYGNSNDDVGVFGSSLNQSGVSGISTEESGVFGHSTESAGVYGFSQNGAGVQANSANAVPLVANLSSSNTSNLFEAKKDGGIISFIDNNGIVGGSGFKTPTGTNNEYLMGDGSVRKRKFIENFTTYTGAGILTEQILSANEITANFFQNNDFVEVFTSITRTGLLGNNTVKIYINTSNSLTGATQIYVSGTLSFAAQNIQTPYLRFIFKDGFLKGNTGSATGSSHFSGGLNVNYAYNFAQSYFLIVTVQQSNVNEVSTQDYFSIFKLN